MDDKELIKQYDILRNAESTKDEKEAARAKIRLILEKASIATDEHHE